MKITKIGLLVYILLNIVACRQEKKSEIKKSEQKKEKKVSISSNTVYLANVNEKYGTDVLTKTNIKSKSIGVLSHNTKVEILRATGKFEEIELYNKKKVLGQWLEIFYPNKKNISDTCYVFDYYLDYKIPPTLKTFKKLNFKDTMYVKNETEFIQALASNRLIIVETDTLNFSKISPLENTLKENKTSYQCNQTGELQINNYKNIHIKANKTHLITNTKNTKIITFNHCENIIIDNVHIGTFNVKNSENVLFINIKSENSNKEIQIIDSENIYFINCYFNEKDNLLRIYNSTTINIDNSIFHNSRTLLSLIYTENRNTINKIQVKNCLIYQSSTILDYDLGYENIGIIPQKIETVFYNCTFRSNQFSDALIEYPFDSDLQISLTKIENCIFENNEGSEGKPFFILENRNEDDKIIFSDCIFRNNDTAISKVEFAKAEFIDTSIDWKEEDTENEEELIAVEEALKEENKFKKCYETRDETNYTFATICMFPKSMTKKQIYTKLLSQNEFTNDELLNTIPKTDTTYHRENISITYTLAKNKLDSLKIDLGYEGGETYISIYSKKDSIILNRTYSPD